MAVPALSGMHCVNVRWRYNQRWLVERLLKSHDQVGDFLEQPAPEAVPEAKAWASVGEKPGNRIGRYKLLQQIGEGGCGVVYMKPDWFLDSENQSMKSKFILFRRAGVFYSEDTTTGKQHSLRAKVEAEALAILHSKNEAHRQPVLNLQIARTYRRYLF